MATTFKVLSQSYPTATTLTDSYTVPALTQATVSSIVVCNQNSSGSSFRVSVAVSGAADANEQYLYYNVSITGSNTFTAVIGVTLGPGDIVRVYSDSGNLSFSIFGCEVS